MNKTELEDVVKEKLGKTLMVVSQEQKDRYGRSA